MEKTTYNPREEKPWEDFSSSKIYKRLEQEPHEEPVPENSIFLHNQLSKGFSTILRAVHYFAEPVFKKNKFKNGSKINVWLQETPEAGEEEVQCSVRLRRPRKREIFLKTKAGNVSAAVAKTFKDLERMLRVEKSIRLSKQS